MTRYEALEKNAVSEPKALHLGNLWYGRTSRKAPLCWEIFSLFIGGEIEALGSMAERVGFELMIRSSRSFRRRING
jgi:hypothetical protein